MTDCVSSGCKERKKGQSEEGRRQQIQFLGSQNLPGTEKENTDMKMNQSQETKVR